jgi:hypothetical protein
VPKLVTERLGRESMRLLSSPGIALAGGIG